MIHLIRVLVFWYFESVDNLHLSTINLILSNFELIFIPNDRPITQCFLFAMNDFLSPNIGHIVKPSTTPFLMPLIYILIILM